MSKSPTRKPTKAQQFTIAPPASTPKSPPKLSSGMLRSQQIRRTLEELLESRRNQHQEVWE